MTTTANRTTHTIVSEQCWNENQSWNYTLTTKTDDGHKVRVRIRRNAHDFQSHAIAEYWNGSAWAEVQSRPITALRCAAVSYVTRGVTAGQFRADANDLIDAALEVIR